MQNQFAQLLSMMQNPNQAISNMINSNPIMKRALEMSNGKSPEEIQQVCKNICQQRGIDYNQALQQFQGMSSNFGINPFG